MDHKNNETVFTVLRNWQITLARRAYSSWKESRSKGKHAVVRRAEFDILKLPCKICTWLDDWFHLPKNMIKMVIYYSRDVYYCHNIIF